MTVGHTVAPWRFPKYFPQVNFGLSVPRIPHFFKGVDSVCKWKAHILHNRGARQRWNVYHADWGKYIGIQSFDTKYNFMPNSKLLPRIYHHPRMDLAVLHIDNETETLKELFGEPISTRTSWLSVRLSVYLTNWLLTMAINVVQVPWASWGITCCRPVFLLTKHRCRDDSIFVFLSFFC